MNTPTEQETALLDAISETVKERHEEGAYDIDQAVVLELIRAHVKSQL